MKSTTGIVLLLIATMAYSAPQVHAEMPKSVNMATIVAQVSVSSMTVLDMVCAKANLILPGHHEEYHKHYFAADCHDGIFNVSGSRSGRCDVARNCHLSRFFQDCIEDAEECEHGNDCCSGVCVFHDGFGHGLCQSEPDPSRVCLKLGSRCREDEACCSDYCCGICKDAPFTDEFFQPQECMDDGGSCDSDRHCCSRRCGLDSGNGRVCLARRQ
ncbi:hypothetical protein HDE_03640 [Halotydeus destructor]|nr:hypothetical protein HDE_03640 [Halotydeus destructor]